MAFGAGATLGTARVFLGVENTQFKRELRQSEQQFDRTVRSVESGARRMSSSTAAAVKGFAGLGLALGAAGLGAFLRGSIDAASDLNEEIAKSGQIFDQNAAAVRKWAQTTAGDFNLSQRAALQYTGQVGAMLETAGIAGDELAKMSERIVEVGADLASFHNEDPSDMLERLRSGLAGEAEPLRRFGVLLSEARVQQEAVNIGLVTQGTKLTEQEKVLARYSIIMKDTATAQGDVARTSDSVANRQRELQKNVENLRAELGQALLPIMASVLGSLNDWAERLQENKELQRDVKGAVRDTVDVVKTMATTADQVAEAIGGWRDTLKLLLEIAVVAKLAKWSGAFKALAGAEAAAGAASAGSGILGAAGAASLLRSRLLLLTRASPYIITLYLRFGISEEDKDKIRSFFDTLPPQARQVLGLDVLDIFLGKDKPKQLQGVGGGNLVAGGGTYGRGRGGKGVTGIYPEGTAASVGGGPGMGTHAAADWQSGNAYDVFAQPGTKVLSPVTGRVVRVSGHDPDQGTVAVGVKRIYGYGVTISGGSDATTYYLAHLDNVTVRPGQRVTRGQVIGYVAAWKGGKAHVHVAQPWGITPGLGIAAGGTDTPRTDPPKPTDAPLIPGRLEESLTVAEGTKGTADDVRALRAIIAYLDKAIAAEKDIQRRISLRRELNQANQRLADLLAPDKKKKKTRDPDDDPLLERMLLRYDQALLTKRLDDDIAALNIIIAYLEKRYEKEKNITNKRRLLADLRSYREALAERQASKAAAASAKDRSEVESLVGRGIPGVGSEPILFEPRDFSNLAPEKQERMAKISRDLETQIKPLRDYWQQLFNKQKALKAKRAALQRTLNKLNKVKPRLRDRAWAQRRQSVIAQIAELAELIGQLQEAMDDVVAAIADLDATAHSEILRIANEADDTAGGGAGGEGGTAPEPSGPDTSPFSQADVDRLTQQNVLGFLGGVRDLRQFQSNVYGDVFDQLNPLSALGGTTLLVNNYFLQQPGDPHAWSKGVEFELRAALGA